MASKFSDVERLRTERAAAWGLRDGYTPQQRCAIAIAYRGMANELLLLAPKQTLRVLLRDGLIDEKCHATKKCEQLVKRWCSEDWNKKLERDRVAKFGA